MPGLLEPDPEGAVDQADRREVLHAAEADALQLVEEDRHQPERVGAADAREHRRLPHDRQHLARHVDDDRVRVAVRHQPGERAAAAHAVAAAVVDDDQVGAAGLGELRREARAGAGADDRRPAATWARSRASASSRVIAAPSISSCSRSAIAVANAGSLIVLVALVHLDRAARASRAGPRAAPRRPRGRGTAGPSTAIIETPPSGTKSAVGPVAAGELAADLAAELARTPRASCASA